jgi:hypothetical protein
MEKSDDHMIINSAPPLSGLIVDRDPTEQKATIDH